MKKSTRQDRRNLIEPKAAQAEEAVEKDDSRAVYKITNAIIGKNSSIQHGPVKDPSGMLIGKQSMVNEVQVSQLAKLLNRLALDSPPDILLATFSISNFSISRHPPKLQQQQKS